MGQGPALLLVGRLRPLAQLLAAALLASCGQRAENRVPAQEPGAYFLWAGVPPPPKLDRAQTVYLLAGEVRARDPGRIVRLRAVPRAPKAEVWLTVRVERIDWPESTYRQLLAEAARWEAAGNPLAGVQIDFDAATRGLESYAEFLSDLRRRLPGHHRLSVTGLMDWSAQGDPAALARLAGIVDEVVIQTYQGRRTIPGYEGYMASLSRLPMPYRIAIVEDGAWRAPEGLESDPEFRGYVVFLLGDQGAGIGARPE